MEHKLHRDKNRPSYFGNVKTRLGSKLHAGVTRPPGSISGPWETQPQVRPSLEARSQGHSHQPCPSRPLGHVPHIRNARLRQYYLQGAVSAGTTWEAGVSMVKPSEERDQPTDKHNRVAIPGDTVFSITSQFSSAAAADVTRLSFSSSSSSSSSSTLISRQHLRVPKGKAASDQLSSPAATNPDLDLGVAPEPESDPGSAGVAMTSPPSPSPDADYDKLLDVEAVPMPDGQLCLLALPPECSQGEGPEATPYLKLFCRSITDRKGVVSGILLVTSNKIFFDPCQSHPLVREHGCEEYLLSCSVDALASITFFSDISHVHFNSSTHRWKGKKTMSQSAKRPQRETRGRSPPPHHQGETDPTLVPDPALRGSMSQEEEEERERESESRDEAERQLEGSPLDELEAPPPGALGVAVLSSATFCCGGEQEAEGTRAHTELGHAQGTGEEQHVKNQGIYTTGSSRPSPGRSGGLMFVRLRVQTSTGNRKGVLGLPLGTTKTSSRQDIWFTLSQESSDELHAYLRHCRPDLSILEGGAEREEGEGEGGEEEFVLVDDEEDDEEPTQTCGRAGEDWEMVSVEESMGKLAVVVDKDPEGLSEIVQQSRILGAAHVRELSAELPPRTVGYAWRLAYSTFRHGSSLKSLYRRLRGSESPVLIVIKDALDQVFGSFLSHPLRPSETFYGTGETFLFLLQPRFKCFRWTGENSFFIKGDLDSFAIGGGSGHFGLWLDEALYLGRSSPCYTFNNCCLSETDDFRVMELEAWTFC